MKKTVTVGIITGFILAAASVQFIFPHAVRAKSVPVMKGVVASDYGMVKDARVRIAGQDTASLTDVNGRFVLEAPAFSNRPVTITAGKEGWFNNSVSVWPGSRYANIRLYPTPARDDPEYRFISPAVCARCHNTLARYWDRSKMAHTTSNGKVLNMYTGTDVTGQALAGPGFKIDNPKKTGDCIACHAPSAAVSKHGATDIETALWSPKTEWDGISCDFCHKIRKVVRSSDTPSLYKPILKRQTPYRGNSILVFGPYDDVVNTVMSASFSPIFDKGSYCAVCHSQVKKTDTGKAWNRQGVYSDSEWKRFDIGDDTALPVQTTYQEWKGWQNSLAPGDSNKGKKCQDCHMSWRKEMLPYDNYVVDAQARNMWGVKRAPDNIRPHHFDGGTQTQLKTALAMEIEGKTKADILTLTVFITNTNGGHWIPTGDPMRHVMLVISARDSRGRELELLKGERLPSWTGVGKKEDGNYSGLPGSVFSKILGDSKGNINVPFWKASSVVRDTRIRPKTTVTLTYQFKLTDPGDESAAEAKLVYRPFIKSLAEIKKWNSKDIVITASAW